MPWQPPGGRPSARACESWTEPRARARTLRPPAARPRYRRPRRPHRPAPPPPMHTGPPLTRALPVNTRRRPRVLRARGRCRRYESSVGWHRGLAAAVRPAASGHDLERCHVARSATAGGGDQLVGARAELAAADDSSDAPAGLGGGASSGAPARPRHDGASRSHGGHGGAHRRANRELGIDAPNPPARVQDARPYGSRQQRVVDSPFDLSGGHGLRVYRWLMAVMIRAGVLEVTPRARTPRSR